jgi:hypothetical protein
MHAVVTRVKIGDPEKALQGLTEEVVPRVSEMPGFVAGHWTRSADGHDGLARVLFDSEDAARAAAERVSQPTIVAETVTLESVEVREVVAQAQAS